MLHFVAFPASDESALAALKDSLGQGDVLVFCDAGRHWPDSHPLTAAYPHLRLTPGESSEQLAVWLATHGQSLYWAPSV